MESQTIYVYLVRGIYDFTEKGENMWIFLDEDSAREAVKTAANRLIFSEKNFEAVYLEKWPTGISENEGWVSCESVWLDDEDEDEDEDDEDDEDVF